MSGPPQEAAKGAELLLLGMLLQHYAAEQPDVSTATLEVCNLAYNGTACLLIIEAKDCLSATARIFFHAKKSNGKKAGKEKAIEEAADASEPIDIIVDSIIGFLEKSTAFLRVVGNQAFSLMSSSVKKSSIDLILLVCHILCLQRNRGLI